MNAEVNLERPSLEEAIVDTVREPLIVLDDQSRVVVASRSYYRFFEVTRQETEGRSLYELGSGQWNNAELRERLARVIPNHTTIEDFEVEYDFPKIGRRTMLLNARKIFYEGNNSTSLLVAIEDVTERRALERDKEQMVRQKDLLLHEMNHRVNNTLQIIASILLLKARMVNSEETRRHLRDAHERIMAVATVQEQLRPAPFGKPIEARSYLTRLCESLAASMIVDGQPISLRVDAGEGTVPSEAAVSMGLIVTELVINAIKHAFPDGAGAVAVGFEASDGAWRLTVSDDGVGIGTRTPGTPVRSGLGTSLVEALTRQLDGRITTSSASPGTIVSITVPGA